MASPRDDDGLGSRHKKESSPHASALGPRRIKNQFSRLPLELEHVQEVCFSSDFYELKINN